ncbi:hypothetical protein ACA910_001092 [Epithemia clementina (nom. ined.)]
MGSCQSRASPAVVVEATKSIDARSARSGSMSGSQASESTVTISNTQTQHNLVRESIQECEDFSQGSVDDDNDDDDEEDYDMKKNTSQDGELESVGRLPSAPPSPASLPELNPNATATRSDRKADPPERGMLPAQPTSSSTKQSPKKAKAKSLNNNNPLIIRDLDALGIEDQLSPIANDVDEPTIPTLDDREQQRRLLFPQGLPETKASRKVSSPSNHRKHAPSSGMPPAPSSYFAPKEIEGPSFVSSTSSSSSTTKEKSSSSGGSKRHSKSRQKAIGFSPIRTTIMEEEDPEMPSDEEDFCEDLVRNTPRDEPGRLVPVKLKSKPRTSVASIAVAFSSSKCEGSSMVNMQDDKSAVHMHTLSEFQRLKLQVKLQKHQEMKERRVHKVEDRLQDAEAYRKLWMEYKKAEEDLAKMDQEATKSARGPGRRSNSFDLKDSGSWFFDFNSSNAALDGSENPDDNGSQASLSLLSEQSLDAQKRYYAEKRMVQKEKKKQGKLEKKQKQKQRKEGSNSSSANTNTNTNHKPPMQPPGNRLEGATTPDGLARLNMANSAASGATRDYGPVRDNAMTTPLDVEVSFQNKAHGPTDDAGSYVSDLGDESWGGGMAGGGGGGGGSLAGNSYPHLSAANNKNNDYGVKRRIRRYSSYSQEDHHAMQEKLKSLEQSLALMKQGAGGGEGATSNNVAQQSSSPVDAAGSPVTQVASASEMGPESTETSGSLPYGQFVEGLTPALELTTLSPPPHNSSNNNKINESPMPGVAASRRNSGREGKKTEQELAEQIQQAILAANTPTRTTRKSYSRKSKKVSSITSSSSSRKQSSAAERQGREERRNYATPEEKDKASLDEALSREKDVSPVLPIPKSAYNYESPLNETRKKTTKNSLPEDNGIVLKKAPSSPLRSNDSPTEADSVFSDEPFVVVSSDLSPVRNTGLETTVVMNPSPTTADGLDPQGLESSKKSEVGLESSAPTTSLSQANDVSLDPQQAALHGGQTSGVDSSITGNAPSAGARSQPASSDSRLAHDEDGSEGDDSSEATGPQKPTYDKRRSRKLEVSFDDENDDAEQKSPRSRKAQVNGSEFHEEKKDDSQIEPISDLDEVSRTSSVHDPVIASMSKDQFLRISYGNPVSDIVAFRQEETDDEEASTTPSDEEAVIKNPELVRTPQSLSSQSLEEPASNFWTEELDEILLKNIFPERTNAVRDTPPPVAVSVTPETTPSSSAHHGGIPFDSAEEVDSMEYKISESKHYSKSACGRLPDPQGRRISISDSLELDGQE